MNNQFYKSSGIALILGSFLMIATMIFHPVGGGIDYLIKISTVILVTHGMAIASMPISIFGFWGLTKRLNHNNIFSLTAFITMVLGLLAAMLAATINGLALPFFVEEFQGADEETLNKVDLILHYGFALNQGTMLIYIVGTCVSVLLWSVQMISTTIFPKWLGIVGMVLSLTAIIALFSGFIFSDLHGLRIFIFGLITWIFISAYFLIKTKGVANDTKSSEIG